MKVRRGSRRRWVSASVAGLMVAGAAWAQVTSSGVLPPASSVPVVPSVAPVPVLAPLVPEVAPPPKVIAALPPLVLTPPVPPAPKPVVMPVLVEETKVPAVPAVRVTPIEAPAVEVAPVPPVVTPVPVIETAVPKVELPSTVIAPIVKPAKPAMAEIIAVGPKSVDATASFQTALVESKAAMGKVRDLSGHMIHQERVKGLLQPEQTAELRMRATPRSVSLKYIAPSSMVGRELVFVDGRHANKARVKAAGTYGPLAFASVSVSDAKASVDSRHTLADTGIPAVIERLERALATESKLRNPVVVTAADFTFANKAVVRYELSFDRPHALRDAARMVVCIDPDTRLPVRFEVYDAPTAGKIDGELREAFSFVNLSFNKGLGDAAFDK